jgi:hypothetical protein
MSSLSKIPSLNRVEAEFFRQMDEIATGVMTSLDEFANDAAGGVSPEVEQWLRRGTALVQELTTYVLALATASTDRERTDLMRALDALLSSREQAALAVRPRPGSSAGVEPERALTHGGFLRPQITGHGRRQHGGREHLSIQGPECRRIAPHVRVAAGIRKEVVHHHRMIVVERQGRWRGRRWRRLRRRRGWRWLLGRRRTAGRRG